MSNNCILVCVLRPATGDDSTNEGVSSRARMLYLCAARAAAPEGVDLSDVLILVQRHIFGGAHCHAVPAVPAPEGGSGYMNGGNFVHTSDSRYRDLTGVPYPIPIHDRTED